MQTKDVLKVKMFILKHRPVYKFTDGPSDADLVSSVYYDNDKRAAYPMRFYSILDSGGRSILF